MPYPISYRSVVRDRAPLDDSDARKAIRMSDGSFITSPATPMATGT